MFLEEKISCLTHMIIMYYIGNFYTFKVRRKHIVVYNTCIYKYQDKKIYLYIICMSIKYKNIDFKLQIWASSLECLSIGQYKKEHIQSMPRAPLPLVCLFSILRRWIDAIKIVPKTMVHRLLAIASALASPRFGSWEYDE
jgi:hypothetical protein